MLLYVKRLSSDMVAGGREDFGFIDQKGRACGYLWTIYLEQWQVLTERQAIDEEYKAYFRLEEKRLKTPYRVRGSPTRNGQCYGPTNWTDCASLDAAQKNVANRIKNAQKRDHKKFVTSLVKERA